MGWQSITIIKILYVLCHSPQILSMHDYTIIIMTGFVKVVLHMHPILQIFKEAFPFTKT